MKRKKKTNIVLQLILVLGIIIVVNLLGGSFFTRIDLTDDKRHTISDPTRELLANLKHEVVVSIFFGGSLPPYYEEYEESMKNMLEEMRLSSNGLFDYQFIDPAEDPEIFERFARNGFPPVPLSVQTSFTSQEKVMVLPYAEFSYQKRNSMLNLIRNAYSSQQDGIQIYVDEAMRRFEYTIISEVFNLTRDQYRTVGLLKGHGEYQIDDLGDLYRDTDRYYNFIQVDLRNGRAIGPSILDLLIIAQPDTALSDREVYEIDQYLMRGGQVLFLVDFQRVDFTIGEQRSAMTFLRNTNLDQLFMGHGIKLNYNLINDLSHGKLAVGSMSAAFGNENVQVNWPYFPMIRDLSSHPTTLYVGKVLMRYASSIDTFPTEESVTKIVLMRSSSPTRLREGAQFIELTDEVARLKSGAANQFYNQPGQITGILVEGQFLSIWQNRRPPTDSSAPSPPSEPYLKSSYEGKTPRLVLIADGEFAKGTRGPDGRMYLPVENKIMMQNLIDYMTGQDLLTRLRPRAFNERKVDAQKVEGNRFKIQLLNIGLPLALVMVFGLVRGYLRRRKNFKRSAH